MSDPLQVLIIEDSADDALLLAQELKSGGLEAVCERVETEAALKAALGLRKWDVIICDYSMPELSGPEALAIYRQTGLDVPFISISGCVGEEAVAETLKAGAHDYVMKTRLVRLVPAIRRELQAAQERRERRESERMIAFLASIVESCSDAIIGETLEGTVVTWNSGAERLYGYSSKEMIGRSTSVLFPAYRPEEPPDILDPARQGQDIARFETVRLRKDGTPVEVSLTVSPIRDATGHILGASTIARDITQRRQEENERLGLIRDLTAALAQTHSLSEAAARR
ncbi:MAG TPA: PAS domain S-box protein [Candidatus Acidoferrum sp.]|nr:PAS domain S-box protein [Candidatus Acidoferrum sp.]